jgi:hypothetical protein
MQRSAQQEGGVHGGTHFSTLFMSESLERHVYVREARTVDDKKIYRDLSTLQEEEFRKGCADKDQIAPAEHAHPKFSHRSSNAIMKATSEKRRSATPVRTGTLRWEEFIVSEEALGYKRAKYDAMCP